LQLSLLSAEQNAELYQGEWASSVIPITNDWLCISVNLSVPATFHVSVDLLTNTSTKTVYAVDNVVGETVATDMLTVFQVQVDATQTSYSQLVIYVSEGTVIRNVDIQNLRCNVTGKFVTDTSVCSRYVPICFDVHTPPSIMMTVIIVKQSVPPLFGPPCIFVYSCCLKTVLLQICAKSASEKMLNIGNILANSIPVMEVVAFYEVRG